MNPFEQAMRMELEAEKYYRDMAEKSTDDKIKGLLVMLANEEAKHYKAFEKMSKDLEVGEVAGFDITPMVKEFFGAVKADNKRYSFNDEQIEFYKKAAAAEDKAYNFYIQKANEMDDAAKTEAFLKIAAEEKKHQELLNNLAEFVEAPQVWLESAEFYKLVEEED